MSSSTFTRRAALFAVAGGLLLAAPAGAEASPPPAGACVTHGEVGRPYRTGVNCRTVVVDGQPRRFVVYVPRHRPVTGRLRPVVFMFHGSSGTGEQFLRTSGWREQADETGLVAVFPTGLRYRVLESGRRSTKWNSFDLASEVDLDERPSGYPESSPWPADDVGFVDRIVGDLGRRLPIDRRRIYASGFSNGASFAARLSVERSSVLAAAGYSGGALDAVHAPARPVPTYLMAGTLDDRILAHTGPPPLAALPLDPSALLGIPVVRTTLGSQLGTLGLPEQLYGAIREPNSTTFRWPATGSGPGGAVMRFSVLEGLRHNYANEHNNPHGFEAAPEFWDFFRSHRLPVSAGAARLPAQTRPAADGIIGVLIGL
jgi:poly(3-hydroxybutyrate) depolymerase